MEHPQKTTPRDFFLHLAVFAALYVSAVSFLRLVFEIIDALFRDPLEYYGGYGFYSGSLRAALASLIVIFPLYLFLSRIYYRGLRADAHKAELWIRKWLIYLTLFVAGGTAVIDLIVLINKFLDGDLTTRFVLKVAVVLFAAAAVFAYFMHDLTRSASGARGGRVLRIYAFVTSAVVLASLVGGFLVVGSPARARSLRFDSERASDLQSIQWQIVNYWQNKQRLPASLDDLNDQLSRFTVPADPKTGRAYEYVVTEGLTFELCADFELTSAGDKVTRGAYPYPASVPAPLLPGDSLDAWDHGAGRSCFERTIDPELHPPVEKR